MSSKLLGLTLSVVTAGLLSACSPSTSTVNTPTPAPAAPTAANSVSSESADTTIKVYSLSEVKKHTTPEDCWLVINGKVYDVTGFAAKHGGGEAIYQGCGLDATTLFETRPMGSKTPHSDKARTFLPNFQIGLLAQ